MRSNGMAARSVRPLFHGERVGVRGYGCSIGHNPSPRSRKRDPTSPHGRGEAHFAVTSAAMNLLIPRLEIALAVITPLRSARRTIAGRLFLIAGARLLASRPLH